MTYVLELRTDKLPQLYLWEPDAYKDKVNSITLYHGIVIGIAGLLALFLTILFVVKGAMMFPAAAALGWAVLVYIGIDFGFWGKVFDAVRRTPSGSGARRAKRSWPRRWSCSCSPISTSTAGTCATPTSRIGWLVFLAALVALALFDPPIASGIARISLAADRRARLRARRLSVAPRLRPRGAADPDLAPAGGLGRSRPALAVTGVVTNDIVGPALLGGLVLIVMLIGFTVMQHAFAGGITHGIVSDVERRALALTGAGDMIWDWDVSADKVFTSPETEALLGLKRGALEGPAARWLEVLHPLDRDRFRAALDSVLEQRRGRLTQDFRLRTPDGHYLWFALKARPVVGSDGEVVRLVGTLTDVTEFKNAEERLLHDAVHDNLTGLPNRELFLDRLEAVLAFAKADPRSGRR